MSAEDSLFKHHQKLHDQQVRRKKKGSKKNQKPEKVLEKQVLEWASRKAIFLHVIEAKAVYSAAAGRYLSGQCEAGLPDLVGNCEGLSMWVELKSPGRRSTLKEHQREFLIRKVTQGCFAVCVDSVEQLASILAAFLSTPASDRVRLMLEHLPKSRRPKTPEEELF